jgi:excisionase family DNA binding protein
MATKIPSMTSSEFAKAAGVSAASISKLIRDGKLKAEKEGGKWMIPQSQLDSAVVRALKGTAKTGRSKPARAQQAQKAAAASTHPPSVPAVPVAPAPAPVHSTAPEAPAPAARREPEIRKEEKTYTIPDFAAMTYLTEKGVAEWLKIGRIKGVQKENGEWRVLEGNLQVADISRLLRK